MCSRMSNTSDMECIVSETILFILQVVSYVIGERNEFNDNNIKTR